MSGDPALLVVMSQPFQITYESGGVSIHLFDFSCKSEEQALTDISEWISFCLDF